MLLSLFASTGMKVMGGVSTALLLACGFFYWQWDSTEHELDNTRGKLLVAEKLNAKLELDLELIQIAALERAQDELDSQTEREELEDAQNNPNDDAGDRNLRVLCVLWKQQGRTGDGLPAACSRFDSSD